MEEKWICFKTINQREQTYQNIEQIHFKFMVSRTFKLTYLFEIVENLLVLMELVRGIEFTSKS